MNADIDYNAPVLYIYNAHNAASLRWKIKKPDKECAS